MNLSYLLLAFVAIMIAMVVHEISHAYTGYLLGDDTAKNNGRLTFNPFKHIDPYLTVVLPLFMALIGGPIFGGAKPIPVNYNKIKYNEWGIAFVAISGPIANLILAFLAFTTWHFIGYSTLSYFGTFLLLLINVNLGFFVFNIIPIVPLDGSRVLYALAPDFVRNLMNDLERYGTWIVLFIIVIFSSQIGIYMNYAIDFLLTVFSKLFI